MTEKGLSDAGHRSAELRYEWQSFLGLLPVLDLRPMDPVLYQRCLTAVWRSRKSAISRTELQQAAGLAFQEGTLDFDLLVAQLVREEILEPIVSSPFHFRIRRRNWTNPESAYAADDRLSLSAITREEQTARFRMLGVLSARISNPRLPEKRVQLLAAAGKGAISAGQQGPRRQCSVAATGHQGLELASKGTDVD